MASYQNQVWKGIVMCSYHYQHSLGKDANWETSMLTDDLVLNVSSLTCDSCVHVHFLHNVSQWMQMMYEHHFDYFIETQGTACVVSPRHVCCLSIADGPSTVMSRWFEFHSYDRFQVLQLVLIECDFCMFATCMQWAGYLFQVFQMLSASDMLVLCSCCWKSHEMVFSWLSTLVFSGI